MSSVDFQKNGYTRAAAMIGHMTRHDGQEVEYRNKYIQPELSGENYIVGRQRFDQVDAAGVLERLRERVREVDEIQPPKRRVKDRVTVMTYTIAAPEGLSEAQERDFFRIAHEELARFSGGRENVSPGFVHRDEIHDYIGTDGERVTSRSHMHVAGIPYTAEKGVNGKAFETRGRMRNLNRTLNERCIRELGFSFMTGNKGLTGRSVEELQAASETRTQQQERARIDRELADAQTEELIARMEAEGARQEAVQARQEALDQQEKNLALRARNKALEGQNGVLEGKVQQLDTALAAAREGAQSRQPRKRIFRPPAVEVPPEEWEAVKERAVLNSELGTLRLRDEAVEVKRMAEEYSALQRERADQALVAAQDQGRLLIEDARGRVDLLRQRSAEAQLAAIRREWPEVDRCFRGGVYQGRGLPERHSRGRDDLGRER